MAFVRTIVFVLCVCIISTNVKAQRNSSNVISLGSSLSPYANLNSTWYSPSGRFGFGFYPQGSGVAIGIWLVNGTQQDIVVWTANRHEPPVSSNSTVLELTGDHGLVLRTEHAKDISITNLSSSATSSPASSAALLDSGNFVIYGHHSKVIWESFDFPTDTILGGQNLSIVNGLVSSVSISDHSAGKYLLAMQADGNLVSYPLNTSSFAYWASNKYDSSYIHASLSLEVSGTLVLHLTIAQNLTITIGGGQNDQSIIYRATLDVDGIFRLYMHNYSSSSNAETSVLWSSVQNQCDVLGFCGFNSYCANPKANGAGDCYCYPGFVYNNPSDKSQGCYHNFTEDACTATDNEDDPRPRLQYKVDALENMSWYNHAYSVFPLTKEVCSDSCLKDCNCWAVLHSDDNCFKYKLPLFGKKGPNISSKGFIKVVQEINGGKLNQPNHILTIESKNHRLILILAASLGSIAFMCFVFAVSSFTMYMHRAHRYKKLLEHTNLGLDEEFAVQSFSYIELERATDGFKEELGRGTFGAVYKGTLSGGSKLVAVKRLEKVVEEGVREFKAEITTIGRTHHRNLVQLLGFCIEGSRKLLVYEYMSHGSLADLLFETTVRPSWRERVKIVSDVAKGVLYLHDECSVHIIHSNLKPQNILLDHSWTAKISDFGLARLVSNETKTSIGGLEQRRGYSAPEWKKNALISVKSDIYSFGIVLLEIVCCRRNIEVKFSAPDEILLSSWVYSCFMAGELNKLVEDENVDLKTLERMVKVGLWCVQDDPALRPLMKNVILMLEGTMDIPVPPSPELPHVVS